MEERKLYNEKDIISKWNSEMYDCNETGKDDVEFALSLIGVAPKHILDIYDDMEAPMSTVLSEAIKDVEKYCTRK